MPTLEHTERRLGVSVAGIELIGVGVTVDVRTGLLDEEEASDGTPAQPTARQLPPRRAEHPPASPRVARR